MAAKIARHDTPYSSAREEESEAILGGGITGVVEN